MSAREFPGSWTDPEYVATVVMVLATGALFFYAALRPGSPSPEAVGYVLLWISLPTAIAYELARRFE